MQGRPKADLSTLPENWQQTIIDLYRDGASDVEVKAQIYDWRGSFSNDLWERWMKEEDDFAETVKKGKALAEAWWMVHGRKNIHNKDFNSTLWYMNMKNRYGWADNQKTTVDGSFDIRQITGMEIK